MSTDQALLERLRQANPVPVDADQPGAMWSESALLANVDKRSDTMKTYEGFQETPSAQSPPSQPRIWWRGPLIAATAAVVLAFIVGIGFWLVGNGSHDIPVVDEPAPTTVVPELSADLSNVGEALTMAHNADDPEALLGLFATDAELVFARDVFTPDEIRAGDPLPGMADNFQYDRSWARVFNDRYRYSSCQVNDDRALCDLTVTTDYLTPLLGSFQYTTAIAMEDGKIVRFTVAQVVEPVADLLFDYQDWTQQNYPTEAELMWTNPANPVSIPTEESALLHLRLGTEYAKLQQG